MVFLTERQTPEFSKSQGHEGNISNHVAHQRVSRELVSPDNDCKRKVLPGPSRGIAPDSDLTEIAKMTSHALQYKLSAQQAHLTWMSHKMFLCTHTHHVSGIP